MTTPATVPTNFSVTTGANVLWTAELPEGGQSGIAVWGDRIFLTVMKPIHQVRERSDLLGADVLALSLSAKDGSILWQRELKGTAKSEYMYGFSDSSSPGPVTDGEHVWFYNASGYLACFDFDGNELWHRAWKPVESLDGVRFPFNKQFEPILEGDTLVNMEPYWETDGKRRYGWNYLVGLDKRTGKLRWISEDALTHYNTPQLSRTAAGVAAVLIGRGGHHQVPELPVGYSLIELAHGTRLWRYEASEGNALYNATWNAEQALWLTEQGNVHVLDAKTGAERDVISLNKGVDLRTFDRDTGKYVLQANIDLPTAVFPAWFTNVLVDDKLLFMCFKEGNYRKNIGPEYAIGRLDLTTSKVEYLEVPVYAQHQPDGHKSYLWHQNLTTETTNVRGLDVAHDKRSARDGWHWNFNGNPIAVNGKVLFTTMLGVTYWLDARSPRLDRTALLGVNDLGPKGKTWSVNTPSFAAGTLYHRTLKHLIAIGHE